MGDTSSKSYYAKSAMMQAHDATYAVLVGILKLAKKGLINQPLAVAKIIYNDVDPELKHLIDKKGGIKEIVRLIHYAKTKGYLSVDRVLTEEGAARLQQLQMKTVRVDSSSWDGIWRMVSFDIPEENRRARDALRYLLKEIGFIQLQLSVWVHPADCSQQINQIKEKYGIKTYILYAEISHIDQSNMLKKKFGLE